MSPHNLPLTPRIDGRLAVVVAVLLFAVSGLADTTYNNFNGYSDYWHPFGYPNTATYGELFTSPNNADHNLASFSFYMGSPFLSGNIITGAYIATWTGSMAGTLLYSAGPINYDNLGNEQITINTGGLALNQNAQYVMFLSISQFYGQSTGEAYVSQGTSISGLNGLERTAVTGLGRQPAFQCCPGAGAGFPDASGNGPSRWHRRPAPQAVLTITIRDTRRRPAPAVNRTLLFDAEKVAKALSLSAAHASIDILLRDRHATA